MANMNLEQLRAKNVIPDVVDERYENLLGMRVSYGKSEVLNGEELLVKQTQAKPHVQFQGPGFGNSADLFSLLMVDPDAPKPEAPKFRNWLHWIVVNIPGSLAPREEIWDRGNEVVAHNGPSPPAGVHRYVFLLFKQDEKSVVKRAPERKEFMVQSFAEKHKLGIPVAATLFTAKHAVSKIDKVSSIFDRLAEEARFCKLIQLKTSKICPPICFLHTHRCGAKMEKLNIFTKKGKNNNLSLNVVSN